MSDVKKKIDFGQARKRNLDRKKRLEEERRKKNEQVLKSHRLK